jgi:hypothetical protein
MSFFGTSFDDPKTAAILGLAGGLLQGNAGAGLQQGLLGYQRQSQLNRAVATEDRQNARQDKLDAYTEEKHKAELAALKRAAMMDEVIGRQVFGSAYDSITGKSSTASGSPSAATSALSEGAQAGSVGPTTANAARMDATLPQQPRGMFDTLPREAVMMDYLINKGKNLPEWLNKRLTPDMQVANGYAFDKNQVQPGFLPGLQTSASGQTTITMPDGRGGVRVQAPEGALDTYKAYLGAQKGAEAGFELVEVPMSDGTVRQLPKDVALEVLRQRQTAPQAPAQPARSGGAIPTLGNANITPEVRGLIEQDAARNGISSPTIRMNTGSPGQTIGLAEQQPANTPSAGPSFGVKPAAPSASRAKQDEKYGTELGEMRAEITRAGFLAPAQLTKLSRMEQLLQGVEGGRLAPAGLEIASAAQSLGIKLDPKLGNKEAAQALAVEMALGMRQPGTGAFTDKDFENFMSTVPGLAKTAEGRAQITATLRAKANRDLELSRMAREYVKQKGALDDGFFDQAAQFMSENPVVVGRGGAANVGGAARVNSDAEYNALPSGSTFVGPDGKTRRKP